MSVQFIPRPSQERGGGDHGWLKTFHTFSFASYVAIFPLYPVTIFIIKCRYDTSEHSRFGSLRVLNEDRVEPHTGFGTHGHREFEIFTYIVAGEIEQ